MNVIDDVLTSYTLRLDSHRSSWPRMQRCMLEDNNVDVTMPGGDLETLRNAETWFVSHGMEFNGNYNLNSGWQPEHAERLRIMIDKGEQNVYSLERPMPQLVELLQPRAEQTQHNLTLSEWHELQNIVDKASVVSHNELWTGEGVVLGDSHAVARYRRGRLVLRNDGLTMYGMLKRGLKTMLEEAGVYQTHKLIIASGNIDIRHHLARQDDPMQSVSELLSDLWSQLEELVTDGYIIEHEVTAPYPIEFEGRKLPKTGYYKGTPFYGSREARREIARYMYQEMLIRFPRVHKWPERWYTMDAEDYATEFMEKPRSVHLSPRHHDWNYEENRMNNAR